MFMTFLDRFANWLIEQKTLLLSMFFIFQNWHDHNFLHYDDIIMFLIFTIIATANIYAFTLFLALDTGRVDQFSCLDT